MTIQRSVRLRRWSLALGTSIAAMGVASSARAQCSPDPVPYYGQSNCTGVDPNGLIVDGPGSRVTVARGAIVNAGPAAAAITTRNGAQIIVNGTVDGQSKLGLLMDTIFAPTNYINIAINAGGSISGTSAIVRPHINWTSFPPGALSISIENAGTVTGTSGAAIDTDGYFYDRRYGLTVVNKAGGSITGAQGTAINTYDGLVLTNAGTINGSVVAATSDSYKQSTIDTLAGTINGDLTLGGGDDVVQARYDAGRLVTGVTGTINGGGGVDTLRVRIGADTSLGALPLPTGFERTGLVVAGGATVTLVDGFTGPIAPEGDGTVINRTTLIGDTQVVGRLERADGKVSFRNAGRLQTNNGGRFAVDLLDVKSFRNDGDIVAAGDGVSVAFWPQSFVNTGTIRASGLGVSFLGDDFDNSGTITSLSGIGASVRGRGRNSGTIGGAQAGVSLASTLVNTGTIGSARTGVLLDRYGILDNRAGGRVSGTAAAIAPLTPGSPIINAAIYNAGIINGDVVLNGQAPVADNNYTFNINRYFALPGGVLNGNLSLGTGDQLVTELTNDGPGAFAGITGRVIASNALLRYRVRSDASASGATPAGFAAIGYDLYDGAALTLTDVSAPVAFAGSGTVDLTGSITTTQRVAIQTVGLALTSSETQPTTPGAVTITSRGTIALSRATAFQPYGFTAVALSQRDQFVNTGTITVRDGASPGATPLSAVSGGTVVNDGSIILDGASGIVDAIKVTNNGSIVQAAGGNASSAITGRFSMANLVNTGTIAVAGDAVRGGGVQVDNSGRIASAGGVAIGIDSYGTGNITNRSGGTIAGNGTAIRLSGGVVVNSGTIAGSVDLGYGPFNRSSLGATYVAQGGTIDGDLRFGDGDDRFFVYDDATGVSGTIDGGLGYDTLVHARTSSGTVTLGATPILNFEAEGVRAYGADTVVTLAAANAIVTGLDVGGTGSVINTATIGGKVLIGSRYAPVPSVDTPILTSFENRAALNDGFQGTTQRFVNARSGTITSRTAPDAALDIAQVGAIDVVNDGMIDLGAGDVAMSLFSGTRIDVANNGNVLGGVSLSTQNRTNTVTAQPLTASLVNTGTIRGEGFSTPLEMLVIDDAGGDISIALNNSGTIEATGVSARAARIEASGGYVDQTVAGTRQVSITNSGTIRANAGGREVTYSWPFSDETQTYIDQASALVLDLSNQTNTTTGNITVTNTATGLIEATGVLSTAISSFGGTLDLTNAGTIRGGAGYTDNGYVIAGAIDAQFAGGNDRIVNTGTIIGSIATGAGDDRVENYGTLTGDVFLGEGDDTFLHRASATLTGTVDGGLGIDSLIVDATGGGTVRASQFVNFERFSQIGNGAVDYVGAFQATTIGVSGGTVTVGAGETLSSTGPVTITGGDAAETVDNAGTITGAVALGAGNDTFVERAGSRVGGGVDGGAGVDTYRVALSGDRSGIGARTGFEQLAVTGTGTLALTLDQRFDSVALAGTGLTLTLAGNSVGAVTGSDAAETLSVDGDIARVALGGGNDTLALGTAIANGTYTGGAGNDTLRFTNTAPVTLAGNANGFETIALAGNTLTIAGTLGATGDAMTLGDGAQALVLANGGTIAGTLDLGAGNDSFTLAPGGTLTGTVAGGAGDDIATVGVAGARTLAASLTGFETLVSTGTGTLTLAGAQSYGQVLAGTDLTIASGGSLTTGTVRMGAGNERLTIAGGFAGAVDGGAGSDTIAVSGGSASAPVAFTDVANVEAFGMSAGYATVSGTAALGSVALAGGRLVGLAGSTLSASRFDVGAGATFGSAGTVNGNVNVAGILSPGASPGTMTVNGNVTLASGSLSVFELTPTVSDKLVVNGALQIANGATLQIVPIGNLRAGTSYDLITASGGITGGFTTISKPASLFGVIVQRADRIQLLGQFLTDARFSPQVARSIAYANATLAVQPATSALFGSLPALIDASGASNARAFAQLTPEAYASATQLGIDHALSLAQVARGNAFATDRAEAGAFTFAQTIGQWHTLEGDAARGSNAARAQSYGFLGGLGYGDRTWMVGAFAGYLNGRQQIGALGARTRADGVVAGVHARYGADSGWGFSASVLYDGGKARTDRALPGTVSATGRYDLHSWVSDVAAYYGIDAGEGWSLRPRLGVTYIRTTRAGVAEEGGSPFALQVASNRHVAGFADAGITLARSDASDAAFRPFVTLGARAQIEQQHADALAGYAGGGLNLSAFGAARGALVGTAAGGVAYRLPSGLDLYASASAQTGRDDHQETITAGVRLRF
ncbi:autotransporter outer membrane beta-barrel domain-containing protein [uncultured Sphingomonas sp.]|uniref:autotransporter outer membrane beta-barrel domain-containing protein n=1 Tax=uncultured Sphingomonas sp. TaxID=158754 RepID=UPI0025D2D46C|nr:autotransporter outer membrane beta-barrel domain-containing protein [uncultured Sphingomonas sp.]